MKERKKKQNTLATLMRGVISVYVYI